jgi:transitional endoplasmic reticulum ATPase
MARIPAKARRVIQDDDVKIGDHFEIPSKWTYRQAINILERKEHDATTPTDFSRSFRARPWDGANATAAVIKRRYGISFGKGVDMGFFGIDPPKLIDIKVGPHETKQVPWGNIQLPALDNAVVSLRKDLDPDVGLVFRITVEAYRMHKAEIEEFFDEVEEYLKTGSIYQGKAIIGYEQPDFLDLDTFNPNKVVYAEEVEDVLRATLWDPIRLSDAFRAEGIPLKRAVLVFGQYGTGKTLTGQMTAKIATDNGWTFIAARPGRDNLEDVMRTARLYMPAVVFYEDIDNSAVTHEGEGDSLSEMLDIFDGITAKGGELIVLMTSNHIERLHKAMLRPGRLDASVEIGALDLAGVTKLVRATINPDRLEAMIEYDKVFEAMEGFYPAFIVEAITRATSVALARHGGADFRIGTHDLVVAANSLRPQLALMEKANEKREQPVIDAALQTLVRRAVDGKIGIAEEGEDAVYARLVSKNGH